MRKNLFFYLVLLLPVLGKGDVFSLNAGYFIPSDSQTRDVYGSNWLLLGVSYPFNRYETFGEERLEYLTLDYINNSQSGFIDTYKYHSKIVNVPLMYNTRYRSRGKRFYYVYGIGFNYLKVRVEVNGSRASDSKIDIGGRLAFGYGTSQLGMEMQYIEFGRNGNTGLAFVVVGRF